MREPDGITPPAPPLPPFPGGGGGRWIGGIVDMGHGPGYTFSRAGPPQCPLKIGARVQDMFRFQNAFWLCLGFGLHSGFAEGLVYLFCVTLLKEMQALCRETQTLFKGTQAFIGNASLYKGTSSIIKGNARLFKRNTSLFKRNPPMVDLWNLYG